MFTSLLGRRCPLLFFLWPGSDKWRQPPLAVASSCTWGTPCWCSGKVGGQTLSSGISEILLCRLCACKVWHKRATWSCQRQGQVGSCHPLLSECPREQESNTNLKSAILFGDDELERVNLEDILKVSTRKFLHGRDIASKLLNSILAKSRDLVESVSYKVSH